MFAKGALNLECQTCRFFIIQWSIKFVFSVFIQTYVNTCTLYIELDVAFLTHKVKKFKNYGIPRWFVQIFHIHKWSPSHTWMHYYNRILDLSASKINCIANRIILNYIRNRNPFDNLIYITNRVCVCVCVIRIYPNNGNNRNSKIGALMWILSHSLRSSSDLAFTRFLLIRKHRE